MIIDLKMSTKLSKQILSESKFQRLGVEQLKARAPIVVNSNGGVVSRAADVEQSEWDGLYGRIMSDKYGGAKLWRA